MIDVLLLSTWNIYENFDTTVMYHVIMLYKVRDDPYYKLIMLHFCHYNTSQKVTVCLYDI